MRRLLVLPLLAASLAHAEAPERLTLEDAIRIARANHPTVTVARRNEEVTQAREREAWAPFLPSLTASFAYLPQTTNAVISPSFQRLLSSGGGKPQPSIGVTCHPGEAGCSNPQPCVLIPGTTNTGCVTLSATTSSATQASPYDMVGFWSSSIGVNWTAWDWGKTYYSWQAAKTNRRAAEEGVDVASLQVSLDVATAFYTALADQELVRVAEDSVADQRRHLDQIMGFFQVGTRTKVDVAQSQSDVANAELQLAQAQGNLASATAVLYQTLGVDTWKPVELIAPPTDDLAAARPVDVEAVVEKRPEVQQLELQRHAFELQEHSVRAGHLPSLTLSLGPSFAGPDLGTLTTNFSISVTLSYPGGYNPALVLGQQAEQRANAAVLEEQARATRNGVRLEIAQAQAALDAARASVVASQRFVAAAKERRDLADARFSAGVGTLLDLQDAEFTYVNARAQLIQAQVNVGIARSRLTKAQGLPLAR